MRNEHGYLDHLRTFDSLTTAERITGKSITDDEGTNALAMGLHMENSVAKKHELRNRGDTVWGETLDYYLKVIRDLGFETILQETFQREKDGEIDLHLILAHPDGLLLNVDTFGGPNRTPEGYMVNGADLYFQWKPHPGYWQGEKNPALPFLGSHGWMDPENVPELPWEKKYVFLDDNNRLATDSDGRTIQTPEYNEWERAWGERAVCTCATEFHEAVRRKMEGLRAGGIFYTPWTEPGLFARVVFSHAPIKQEEYNRYIARLFPMFPDWVQEFVGGIDNLVKED